jgi:putative FmdB family regulatory protein
MPIYEYQCRNCDATFEALVQAGAAAACPHCGSSSLDKLLTAPFISSGRTARQPGHTCCGQEERCDTPPCSAGETCRRAL